MRKWRNCSFKLSVRSFSGIYRLFRIFRARKVQKLPAWLISSELRAHQMSPSGVPPHWRSRRALQFIRAECSSNGSCRSHPALQPTCRIRRAHEPKIHAEVLSNGDRSLHLQLSSSTSATIRLTPRRLYFDFLLPSHFFGSSVVLIGGSILSSSCACRSGSRKTLARVQNSMVRRRDISLSTM